MNIFETIGLGKEILDAIKELGFESPTKKKKKTIPYLLNSNVDLLALAQTGTGKTAAFGLPILQQIETSDKHTQAIILSPTRELCLQITNDLKSFAKNIKGLKVAPVFGGANIETQIKDLRSNPHIVVGTPGRTIDLLKRKKLKIANVKWLILDEADEMLSMGFKEDLNTILASTPEEKQTLLFSATMSPTVMNIAKKYMHNPEEISAGKKNSGAENVLHHYYMVHSRDKYEALKRIADLHPKIYGIVFCRTRRETKEIADKLIGDGYNADALHGDLSQAQRDQVMSRFRNNHLQILVATDVAARGLDVNSLTHVINYGLPDDPEVYVHRSGRTGRAGKKGTSISITHLKEKGKIKTIEKLANKTFERKNIPSGKDICKKQLFNLIDKVENTVPNHNEIQDYLPEIYSKLEWLSREELIQHFVSVEFNRFLSYYENAKDINVKDSGKDRRDKRDDRGGRKGKGKGNMKMSRFFIGIGKKDRLNKGKLLDIINQNMPVTNVEVGKIEILSGFSFFEVDTHYESDVLKSFKKFRYNSNRVSVELAKEKGKRK
ncbi:MAG: DEAD/DEAH box helicase [Bacteroidales bacterium]|nr:DEAD/DEAH box helicase [Bacteroidales bacterium]